MINIKELYKDCDGYFWDYKPMIEAFGNIAIIVEDDDYQGDTRVLYNNKGKIGHLIFGWGSCPGCDALQACNTIDDVQELCNELERSIEWFDNAVKALAWFEAHDWEGDWTWNDVESRRYISSAIDYLKSICNKENTDE